MDKKEEHWDLPRTSENAWLFKPNFDTREEEKLPEKENKQQADTK